MVVTTGRLHYVDWLRVLAFGLLILYHCSVAFFPDMSWLVKSGETSQALSWAMDFPRAWRLALLFFVSGMGTWFAFRSASGLSFLRDRALRLLVPLLFAMAVVVVPQVWLERVMEEGYQGSLWTFWIERYFTEGKYPSGNFTWAHMWFVAYLLVMVFLLFPIFRFLASPRGEVLSRAFAAFVRSPFVYLLFLVPLALNLALSPVFPRQTNALYNDGAWFAVWASWFGFGFLFARHHAGIIGSVVVRRWRSAALSLALTAALYVFCFLPPADAAGSLGSWENQTPVFKALVLALAWTMILTAIGFAAVHLDRRSAALAGLNGKVFALYIVHQTVIVWALYYVLPIEAGAWTKFGLVVLVTAGLSLAVAMAAERLPWPLRLAFGFADRPAARRAQAGAPRPTTAGGG
jgi:peptidoglycan/LPS O-acetylase OafA/YrhL